MLLVSLQSRRLAGGILQVIQTINHRLPFSPVNSFIQNYFSLQITFQMVVRLRLHLRFGLNRPITGQLSNEPWQIRVIA